MGATYIGKGVIKNDNSIEKLKKENAKLLKEKEALEEKLKKANDKIATLTPKVNDQK